MKKFLRDALKIIVALIIGGAVVYNFKINTPINSNNSRYTIYANQAIFGDNGTLTINGMVKDNVTGNSVAFATQTVTQLGENQ